VLDAPAPIGDEWEDVVEASFRPANAKVALVQWAGQSTWPLPLAPIRLPGPVQRDRYGPGAGADTLRAGEPLLDRYLLLLWPAR